MAAASKIPQGGQIPLEQKKIATVNTSTGMTEVLVSYSTVMRKS